MNRGGAAVTSTMRCELCGAAAVRPLPRHVLLVRDLHFRTGSGGPGPSSDAEHQAADWEAIHEKVCTRLAVVRGPSPPEALQVHQDAHRAQTRLRLEELLAVSREEARGRLVGGRHQEALPALQLALTCGLEVFGSGALQLVPLYLLLGRAYMGLGRLGRAREFLSQAEWVVLQTPGCERPVLHQLHRSLGSLHLASGDLDSALFHLATDVYYATEEFGLDSTVPCGGYFLMAQVFGRQEKRLIARSLYSQVVGMWHRHLTTLCEPFIRSGSVSTQSPFDQTELVETDRMLRSMLAFTEEEKEEEEVEEEEKEEEVPAVLLGHSLAMLWFLAGDAQQVLEFGRGALQTARLVPEHRTGPIQDLLRVAAAAAMQTQEPPGPPSGPPPDPRDP